MSWYSLHRLRRLARYVSSHEQRFLNCRMVGNCAWPSVHCQGVGTIAQVFRSIDSDSADGFPASSSEAAYLGLDSSKGRIVDFSIQKAYINAIRQVWLEAFAGF